MSEVDGLQLHVSSSNATGYLGVTATPSGFLATYARQYLGSFGTAVEAAVAYARHAGPAPPPKPKPAVVEEFDGLRLHLSSKNSMGYLGVSPVSGSGRFQAQLRDNGKQVYIGTYDTAVEAAAAYARTLKSLEMLGVRASLDKSLEMLGVVSAAGSMQLPAQPAALDECDVLQLHLSATNPTGYKDVYVKRGTGRFEAKVCSHGQLHHIGNFDTALQAAEAYARHVQSLESA